MLDTAFIIAPRVCPAARLPRRVPAQHTHLEPEDSALYALTDFKLEHPIAVDCAYPIAEALKDMERLNVHALLVTERLTHDACGHIIGLLTAADIRQEHAEHPVTQVEQAMTATEDLSLVNYESLVCLSAIDLHRMFQGSGLTHLLVVESHGEDAFLARGLLSRAALAHRLQMTAHATAPS